MLMDSAEFKYLYGTVAAFGVITFVVYYCLLRPFFVPPPRQSSAAAAATAAATANGRRNHQVDSSSTAGARRGFSNADSLSSSGRDSAAPSARLPPHILVASSSALSPGTSTQQAHNCLVDGLVSFRQTLASRRSDGMSPKDRAGILSNLLMASSSSASEQAQASWSSSLPSRGSAWIMAVPVTSQTVRDEFHFARIRPVLHALGTHYNLLVVLAVSVATTARAAAEAAAPGDASSASNDAAKKLRAAWIAKVRQQDSGDDTATAAVAAAASSLTRRIEGSVAATTTTSSSAAAAAKTAFASLPVPADVLPSHRIVAASTVAGRVAFVRQVQRVGLVVDFDPAVHEQLSRFGHKVMVYDFDKL